MAETVTPISAALALSRLQLDLTTKMAENKAPDLQTITKFAVVVEQVQGLVQRLS